MHNPTSKDDNVVDADYEVKDDKRARNKKALSFIFRMSNHHVFGYASLIHEGIRNSLNLTGKAEIVEELPGVQRVWDPQIPGSKRARLNLKADKYAHTNGVVLQVDEAELRLLDGLNKGYARVHLEDHIHGKDNHPTFQRRGMSSTVWIYLPNGNMNPTNQGTAEPGKSAAAPDPNPIVQTYVDQVVIGALRLGGTRTSLIILSMQQKDGTIHGLTTEPNLFQVPGKLMPFWKEL